MIGVITILVSVGASFAATRLQLAESQETNREQSYRGVLAAVEALISIRAEYTSLLQQPSSPTRAALDMNLNARRQLLIAEIESLIASEDISESLTANLLLPLGNELIQDSRFADAEALFQRALAGAPDIQGRVVACRNLGSLYMTPNTPVTDIEKGREHWERAMRESAGQLDGYTRSTQVQTLLNWALAETWVKSPPERTERLLDRAAKITNSLDPRFPFRDHCIREIRALRESVAMADQPFIDLPAHLQGTWELRFLGNDKHKGSGHFFSSPVTPLGASFDLFDKKGHLVERISAFGQAIDPRTLRMEWQSLTQSGPKAGSLLLSLRATDLDTGTALAGEMHVLGQASRTMELSRPALQASSK